ncbi:hypothetical protein GCM10010415_47190 [Streptomyces atrovirens]|uniref:Sialidase family protein n=1 Tax=Streptomyces atrovirens TaxID=285556 RepID=A0ABW0E7C5_9ACTN
MSDEQTPDEQSADEQPDHVLMSMSVSRDGGRTWSEPIEVMPGDELPSLMTSTWPPCECYRCVPIRRRELSESLRLVNERSRTRV